MHVNDGSNFISCGHFLWLCFDERGFEGLNMREDLVERYVCVAREMERRKQTKLARYNKGPIVHKKQMLFHASPKRNRWVFGGNRSGKSECGAVEVVWLARGIHPFRNCLFAVTGWVVSPSTRVQKDVAQKKILSYLDPAWIEDIVMVSGKKSSPEYGVVESILVKSVCGGISVISFKSCEEGREKFQGASLDFVWFDEEPPKDIYDECRMRIIDRSGDIFGTMTPLKGLTFVYDEIYLNKSGDDEVFFCTMEWADNPFIPQKEIERMTRNLSADELRARRFGEFLDAGNGLVYPEFDFNIHVVEPFSVPKFWHETLSIDPGLNNPLSCHWYAVDGDGNIFVIAEHYEAGKNIDYHASKIKEISNNLGWHIGRSGRIEALIDAAATQRTLASTKSVVELFFEQGIAVNPRVNKDVFSGIARVKTLLRNGEGRASLFIFKNCVNLIREIKGYRWGNEDAPIKRDDHALDELRYFVMSRPDANAEMYVPSAIQRDKANLARKLARERRERVF